MGHLIFLVSFFQKCQVIHYYKFCKTILLTYSLLAFYLEWQEYIPLWHTYVSIKLICKYREFFCSSLPFCGLYFIYRKFLFTASLCLFRYTFVWSRITQQWLDYDEVFGTWESLILSEKYVLSGCFAITLQEW